NTAATLRSATRPRRGPYANALQFDEYLWHKIGRRQNLTPSMDGSKPRGARLSRYLAAAGQMLVVAAAGYAVVGVFGLTYAFLRSRWPTLSQASAVNFAVVAAAPLALAMIWHRLTGFKLFGLEVSLSQATARIETGMVGAIAATQYFSGNEAIVERITQA